MNDALQSLRENGYSVVKSIAPETLLQDVWIDIATLFSQSAKQLNLDHSANGNQESVSRLIIRVFEADRDTYFATAKLAQHLASLQRMSTLPVFTDLLREMGIELPAISTRQVLHIISSRLRITGGYDRTPPHQDWRSVQGSLNGLTLWIPFWPTVTGQHALEVAPGSHKAGLLPSTDHPFGHAVADSAAAQFEFTEVSADRGDVVVLSNFLLHRTGETGDEQVRIAASFRYNDASEKTFIERGYPNPYIYKPDMRLLTPDFPQPGQVSDALNIERKKP